MRRLAVPSLTSMMVFLADCSSMLIFLRTSDTDMCLPSVPASPGSTSRRTTESLVTTALEPTLAPAPTVNGPSTLAPAPTTTLTYASSLQAIPEFAYFKEDPEWKALFDTKVKLAANSSETRKQARPFTEEDAVRVLQSATPLAAPAILALTLWVTASRYGDLPYMRITTQEKVANSSLTILLLDMPGSKGDRTGSRQDRKAVFIPDEWCSVLTTEIGRQKAARQEEDARRAKKQNPTNPKKRNVSQDRPIFIYLMCKEVNKVCKVEDARNMTAHSMRVGATHTLLLQFKMIQIAALTLHGQQPRMELGALTRYTATAFLKEEREQSQLAMSLFLLVRMGRTSPLEAQEISRDRLLPVAF